jgi:alginate production protein
LHARRLSPVLLAVLALAAAAQPVPPPPPPPPSTAAEVQQARDERRREQPFTINLGGHPVQLGGSWEITNEWRDNFDLDDRRARDRRVREHELKLEARTRFGSDTELFLQLVGLHETRRTEGDGRRVSHSLERGPMWLQRERLGGTPWAIQFGRITLLERRAWWWDEDLDGVRVRYLGDRWRLDTGLVHEGARQSSTEREVAPDTRGVTRWFGQATWPWAPRHALEAFWLVQRDRSSQPARGALFADEDSIDPSDLDARWFGLRASGEWRGEGAVRRFAYWADTAWLSGRERTTDFDELDDGRFLAGATRSGRVHGHALDFGATAAFGLPLRPSLTVAYARGSEGFRQTGLQENKARFAGVKRWQRYGELLQPELANFEVITVGTGIRIAENSSLELLLHRYRQVRAAGTVAGSRLATDPQGRDRSLGREVDLLLAVRESRHVEFFVKASWFRPGSAFPANRRDPARALELGLVINF